MKLAKVAVLAATAAIAATAFMGAGTASAATLCKVNESPCAAANQWPEHVTILALSTKAVLKGTLNVTCHSHVTILVEKNDAGKVLGKITLLDWTSCSGCSPVTTLTSPSGSLTPTSGGNGTLTTESLTEVELKNCPFGVTCKAKANTASLSFTGGSVGVAKASAEEVPVTLSGGLCGTSGKWNAGGPGSEPYVVTEVGGSTTGSIFVES